MKTLDPDFALVVLSGGQDSTTCLGWALEEFGRVACVTFNYGQKHIREIGAARDVVRHFTKVTGRSIIDHETILFPKGMFAGTSPLTNPDEQLETYANAAEMDAIIGDRVEKTFVPMRNAVFLMVAANRAVCMGAGALVTGVCQADNANYPDCRASFIEQTEHTINFALGLEEGEGLVIETPLMDLSKAESVALAMSLPNTYEALAYSHTAYDGSYPPTSKDHASVLRAAGFEEAGFPDPLVLRAWREGLMELPDTENYFAVTRQRALDHLGWK